MEIEVRRSRRKSIAIEVTADARVIVRAPQWMTMRAIKQFVNERTDWIEKSLEKVNQRRAAKEESVQPGLSEKELQQLAFQAKQTFRLRWLIMLLS